MAITTPVTVSLGLQGGGTYGAFTWGVLDRLLDEEHLRIDALTGSSAGAINLAVAADGYALGGGPHGAKAALRRFWTTLGQLAVVSPLQRTPLDRASGRWILDWSPAYHLLETIGALSGPVPDLPLTQNPLRNLLAALIDFDRVRRCEEWDLYVATTNVRTGMGRLFQRAELDVQKVLASACLPTVFAGVEIDGELYWDGSYVANPPLAPLLERGAGDVIVIQTNPVARTELPRSVADISNRSNEIAFNVSFIREISTLLHAHALPAEERSERMTFAPMRLHLISGNEHVSRMGISSKFNAELPLLEHLHACGVAAADAWLTAHGDQLGRRSTLDPRAVFQ